MNTILKLEPVVYLSSEQFTSICHANPEAKLELTARGELVIVSPTGGETGNKNIKLLARLENWAEQDQTGLAFDSSTMFRFANNAFRSPDAAWIQLSRWNTLTEEQKRTFPPICPDFIIELRSPSDSLKELREKMQEYINNGVQLGWLIDPINKQVEIYRIDRSPETFSNPTQIEGENILPGFILSLNGIL
jgi:Uma2 family endonuclease